MKKKNLLNKNSVQHIYCSKVIWYFSFILKKVKKQKKYFRNKNMYKKHKHSPLKLISPLSLITHAYCPYLLFSDPYFRN